MIFGLHAWAPYVINVVLIFGLLWLTYFLLSDLTPGERLFFACLPLLLPISARLVQEFRPDAALAVVTAAFCLGTIKLSFFAPAVADCWRTQFRFGLVAGLALLVKPSFLYHTLVIMALTQVCSALGVNLQMHQAPASRRSAGRAAAFFGAAILVSGGYYIRALPETLSYIHTNTANRPGVEIYRQHLHTLGAILDDFLVNGEMGRMLGPFSRSFSPSLC